MNNSKLLRKGFSFMARIHRDSTRGLDVSKLMLRVGNGGRDSGRSDLYPQAH